MPRKPQHFEWTTATVKHLDSAESMLSSARVKLDDLDLMLNLELDQLVGRHPDEREMKKIQKTLDRLDRAIEALDPLIYEMKNKAFAIRDADRAARGVRR